MVIDQLPVLTWEKTGLNRAELELPKLTLTGGSYRKPTALPEGMTRAERSAEEYAEWIKRAGDRPPREAVVAGKHPTYAEQDFPTGMGAEMDALLHSQEIAYEEIKIAEGVRIAEPVVVKYDYKSGADALHGTYVHAGKYSEATLIEYYTAESGEGTIGVSTRVLLEEGARLHLIRVQMLPTPYLFLGDMGARLLRRSSLEYTEVQLGAGRAYAGAYADQWGAESVFRSDLAYLGTGGSFLDYNYVDTFRGKRTTGEMYFQGVLLEGARKVSRETLDFRQGCTEADGREAENVLVLGEHIENKANPMILGEEEDVSGQHAVTVGKLSPEMLYYMQTRGISAEAAEELMVRAQIARVTERIPEEDQRRGISGYLDRLFCKKPDCEGYCKA